MYQFLADDYLIKVDLIWKDYITIYPIWKTRIHRCKQRETLLVFPEGYRYLSLHKKIYPGSGKVYSIQHINKDMTDFRSQNILIKPYKQSYRSKNDIYIPENIYVEDSEALIQSTEDLYRNICCAICSEYKCESHYMKCLTAAANAYWKGFDVIECPILTLLKENGVLK